MKHLTLTLCLLTVTGCRLGSYPTGIQNDPLNPPYINGIKRETTLDKYLAHTESVYHWEEMKSIRAQPTDGDFNLKVISQTWQGKPWSHRLQIFTPKGLRHPDTAILSISFGNGSDLETFMGKALANATGAVVVNVFDVPNQPLFGKYEDALIAFSFGKYLQTGDDTWPLIFPMTKSVIKAMDAIQAWSRTQPQGEISKFIVSGASKRGWTTDLVAAHDTRVIGAIPIVYNNLKVGAQIAHQREVWGGTSPLIEVYKQEGLLDPLPTERARSLTESIDPWSYRRRLVMPKLLINATNDGYWPHDALNLYFNDLPGQTDVFYVPNAPHTLGDNVAAVVGSAAAWSNLLLDGIAVPKVNLSVRNTEMDTTFTLSTDVTPAKVRLWLACSSSKDFRKSKWKSLLLQPHGRKYQFTVPIGKLYPQKVDYAAAFGEIEIPAQPLPLRLSSKMWEQTKQVNRLSPQMP
jgi:PhoPQ-activated pathogenicity-related protein